MTRVTLAVFIAGAVESTFAQQPCLQWQHATVPSRTADMVFDSVRHRPLLFQAGNPPETFEWTGQRWTSRGLGGPSGVSAIAFDEMRGEAVLLYGSYIQPIFSQTWIWNGASWTMRPVTGPSPREDSAMTYDSQRHVIVLFGGRASGVNGQNGETWEWDGTSWTQKLIIGPPARRSHTMTFDPSRGVTVLFGGHAGNSPSISFGDTWEYNGRSWTQVATTGPGTLELHSAAYDDQAHEVIVFGGYNTSGAFPYYQDKTWAWDGTSWTLRTQTEPSNRRNQAMALDPVAHEILMFGGGVPGGDGSLTVSDTWRYSGGRWTLAQASLNKPESRTSTPIAWDSTRNVLVLAGGYQGNVQSGPWLASTWEWDGQFWTQKSSTGFGLRSGNAMGFDVERNLTVMFGGSYTTFNGMTFNTTYMGDTRTWDGQSWTQQNVSGPSVRSAAQFAYDTYRHELLLYGGSGNGTTFGDLWSWNGSSWTLLAASGPPPRGNFGFTYDTWRNRAVMFGGVATVNGSSVYYGETWEWDSASQAWLLSGINGPGRSAPMMTFDQARGVTVMQGGVIPNPAPANVNETWDWNGQTWTQRPIPAQISSLHKGYFNTSTGSVEMMTQFTMDSWRLAARPWDVDCNNLVNIDDLVQLITQWGPCPIAPQSCFGDANNDGQVNIDDLVMVITHWG